MKDKLKALGERALDMKDVLKTEEATKTALVIPFLMALGYDVYNPLEVVPEFNADVGIKKGEKVDYAIIQNDIPVMLVECKHHTEDLSKHGSQLFRYYSVIQGRKIGILTNGYDYMLYSDLDKENLKDDKPFFEFNITTLTDSQIEEISKLQKNVLDMDKIVDTAYILKYTNIVKNIIRKELSEPTEPFITYIVKSIDETKLTKNRYAFFEPLVKKSIRQVIDEIFNDRLSRALQKEEEKEVAGDVAVVNEEKNQIVTTEDELEVFNIIRAIVCNVAPVDKIQYKDTISYFGINIDGKVTRTFCRLFFGKTKKSIEISWQDKTIEKYDIERHEDIYNYSDKIRNAAKSYI